METAIFYIVAGSNYWGRGENVTEAKKVWRRMGGRGKVQFIRRIEQPVSASAPYVDDMGRLMAHEDASVSEVKP